MIKVLKKVPKGTYWSKSQTFLLPLTGLKKTIKYTIKSYLFWEDYSIENYQIMVVFLYDNYDEFVDYCKKKIFPVLDKLINEEKIIFKENKFKISEKYLYTINSILVEFLD